jgi:hypothetical protein
MHGVDITVDPNDMSEVGSDGRRETARAAPDVDGEVAR